MGHFLMLECVQIDQKVKNIVQEVLERVVMNIQNQSFSIITKFGGKLLLGQLNFFHA